MDGLSESVSRRARRRTGRRRAGWGETARARAARHARAHTLAGGTRATAPTAAATARQAIALAVSAAPGTSGESWLRSYDWRVRTSGNLEWSDRVNDQARCHRRSIRWGERPFYRPHLADFAASLPAEQRRARRRRLPARDRGLEARPSWRRHAAKRGRRCAFVESRARASTPARRVAASRSRIGSTAGRKNDRNGRPRAGASAADARGGRARLAVSNGVPSCSRVGASHLHSPPPKPANRADRRPTPSLVNFALFPAGGGWRRGRRRWRCRARRAQRQGRGAREGDEQGGGAA